MNVHMPAIRFIIFLLAGYSACSAHAMPNNINIRNIAASAGGFIFTAAAAGIAALVAHETSNAQPWQKIAAGTAVSISIYVCSSMYASRQAHQELMELSKDPSNGAIDSWTNKQLAKSGSSGRFALGSALVAIATPIASITSYLSATYPAFFYTKAS